MPVGLAIKLVGFLGGVLLLAGLYFGALHLIRQRDAANVEKGKQIEAAHVLARTKALQKQLDALSAKVRSHNDVQATRIVTVEHDVLLRGPGRASCPSVSSIPSGSKPSGGAGDTSVGQVPTTGGVALIALPFNDFVRAAGQCDLNRNEVISDRALYGQLGKKPN